MQESKAAEALRKLREAKGERSLPREKRKLLRLAPKQTTGCAGMITVRFGHWYAYYTDERTGEAAWRKVP